MEHMKPTEVNLVCFGYIINIKISHLHLYKVNIGRLTAKRVEVDLQK